MEQSINVERLTDPKPCPSRMITVSSLEVANEIVWLLALYLFSLLPCSNSFSFPLLFVSFFLWCWKWGEAGFLSLSSIQTKSPGFQMTWKPLSQPSWGNLQVGFIWFTTWPKRSFQICRSLWGALAGNAWGAPHKVNPDLRLGCWYCVFLTYVVHVIIIRN